MNITTQKEKYSDCLYELDFGGGGVTTWFSGGANEVGIRLR